MTEVGIFDAVLSTVLGSVVGEISSRASQLIDSRLTQIPALGGENSLLDNVLGVFLHVGILAVGTQFASNAVPSLTSDPASFSLFMLGVMSTSGELMKHLRALNEFVLQVPKPAATEPEKTVVAGSVEAAPPEP